MSPHEKSLAEPIARAEKAIAWLNTIKPERIDGSEGKNVAAKMRDRGRLKKAQEQSSSQTGFAVRHN